MSYGIAQTYVQKIAKEGWNTVMECANFKASLMKAPRLEDDGTVHSLPQGTRIPVFPITALPACPGEWVREEGVYVCPVDTEWGLWFDWTMNDVMNTAVVPSVKAMNPITGLEVEGPGLEAYKNRCPRHDTEFGPNRLCEECGYRWPAHNYVTHESTLWLDGFRQPDGSVRQFFFTDEDRRDIAAAVIGEKNTVPAFGFVFYRPKVERKRIVERSRGVKLIGCKLGHTKKTFQGVWPSKQYGYQISDVLDGDNLITTSATSVSTTSFSGDSAHIYYANAGDAESDMPRSLSVDEDFAEAPVDSLELEELPEPSETESKSVSVGAGAKIRQELQVDELGIDGWKDENSGIIRLYFVFEEQFRDIVKEGGIRGIQTNNDGFLSGLPVG